MLVIAASVYWYRVLIGSRAYRTMVCHMRSIHGLLVIYAVVDMAAGRDLSTRSHLTCVSCPACSNARNVIPARDEPNAMNVRRVKSSFITIIRW
jgi:hypothetical protein